MGSWSEVEVMTDREKFDKDGYLFIPKLIIDPDNLYVEPPKDDNGLKISGILKHTSRNEPEFNPTEHQVNGSYSVYNNPNYRNLHRLIKQSLQNILNIDLHPTYFYERFYYAGQELVKHTDRPECEISVTLQVSSNSDESWPIYFMCPDSTTKTVSMKNGDAVIYKGCDIPHWREPLKSKYSKLQRKWKNFRKVDDDTYHHQVFFHYINAQGPYVHHAFDYLQQNH